ncbi:fatty acid desaturase [Litoreibacter roseus]|uniref:Fatty acid desaturase n=2 Tax=Litoreibacter roseus TaxID=2601869 RepID=A0A6N6JP81_9RHOB|nr:fatty acid desaturase [Litoreibacter roseus]
MRIFCIQHDCGHFALFRTRPANTWTGRILSLLTFTPHGLWCRMHGAHHAGHGNLDARDLGEVLTLTVWEYEAKSPIGRLAYRVYRHPLFLFGLAPFLLFFIKYRLPFGLWRDGRCWASAMGLNLSLAILISAMVALGGWAPVFVILFPSVLVGATAGVLTFFVQHQFEETYWAQAQDWQVHEAALAGSSYVDLPRWLAWFTANISVHHVHHLYARIPFYRIPEVLRDYPELREINRISLRESLRSVRFHLWDPQRQKMVSFSEEGQRRALSAKVRAPV